MDLDSFGIIYIELVKPHQNRVEM